MRIPEVSFDRVEPGSNKIRAAVLPPADSASATDVHEVARQWTTSFNDTLKSGKFSDLKSLFLKESYWRDQLSLSWDFHLLSGPEKMISFLENAKQGVRLKSVEPDTSSEFRGPNLTVVDYHGKVNVVQSFLNIETDVGRGRGLVRLLQDKEDSNEWKAYTLFTSMHELKGHEETIRARRPRGVEHGGKPGRKNWADRREALRNFEDTEPTVLILGAGQGGLTVAARLKQLGVESLIVDRNQRIGDNWRNRYHQLVLHDPVWYDHLPYIPFPEHWPVFTPKDKLGDWFESYASSLELNAWMSSTVTDSKWDDSKRQWTVTIERTKEPGIVETRTLHPRHVIQATGHSGEKNFPSIPGMSDFKGDRLCHSSQFTGAAENGQGKHAIVVGCCNSGHDIAQDFHEKGYDVTIVQRSSTYVMSSEAGLDVLLGGLYVEGGPPIDDADLLFMSIPNPLLKRIHQDATAEIERRDASLLAGLEKAGFKLDRGPDDAGFFMKYFQRGGGYYIDVGASALIASGAIKIKQGQEIERVNAHSLTFADGAELPADEVVFATGYQNMRGTARKIFGDEVADRVGDVWGFDAEGELRTMWRRTGHPGFWFFGGNLALCRYFSRLTALMIKGMETGAMKYEDP